MFVLVIHQHIQARFLDQFIPAMIENARSSVLNEPGCLRFDVLQDQADENHFFFYEVYRDEEALQAHQQTPHFRRWREAAGQVLDGPAERTSASVLFPKDYK
jgi:quinol monooxygenase YgiN